MDGSSLTGVESAALTQGVAFLYAQAGELLRRRREARDRAAVAGEHGPGQGTPEDPAQPLPSLPPPSSPLPSLQLPESVFEPSGAASASPVPGALDQLAQRLLQARRDVDEYVVGTAVLSGETPAGLQAADRLRCLLEEVYHTALTFHGEQRPARTGAMTPVSARHEGGVTVMGNVRAGIIAGRDHIINKA
jgi:hypothetical protein